MKNEPTPFPCNGQVISKLHNYLSPSSRFLFMDGWQKGKNENFYLCLHQPLFL